MKKFLVLQLRPEREASDSEFRAILAKSGLAADETHRITLERDALPEHFDLQDFAGVIVGGGPGCVSDPIDTKSPLEARMETDVFSLMPQITAQDIPFMGCCYGIGILAHHLGAAVSKEQYGEPIGTSRCFVTDAGRRDPILNGVPDAFDAFVGHKEAAQSLPAGAVHLVRSGPCPFQMIRYGQNVYATQFHPEADGAEIQFRIKVYSDRGYFDPCDAARLSEMAGASHVYAPPRILQNFTSRYRT
ncbi:MAG: glutamine amidotransferase [Pseudomonadota bacterium]